MSLTTRNSFSTTLSGRNSFSVMIYPRTNDFSSSRVQMLNKKSPLMVGHGSVHAFRSNKSPLMVGHGSVHGFSSNKSPLMVGHGSVYSIKSPLTCLVYPRRTARALESEGELSWDEGVYDVMSKVKTGEVVVRDAKHDLEYYSAAEMKAAAIEESIDARSELKKTTNMIIADEFHNFKKNVGISQMAGESYLLSLAVIGDEKVFSLHDSFLGLIETRISHGNPLGMLGVKGGKFCTISFLAVQKQFRRSKVATKMIKKHLDLAREEGAVYAFVNIPTECIGALEMFNKLGFHVIKDISRPGMKMNVALYPLNSDVSMMN